MSPAERLARAQLTLHRLWATRIWGVALGWLGWLYRGAAAWRRARLARRAWISPAPVIVVGNLSVGGVGKTPLTRRLAQLLREAGRKPGVASRGWGRRGRGARLVGPDDEWREVGDEPLWLAQTCPVAVGARRAEAVKLLIDAGCDLILCDDGLQHYQLGRDIEIAVIDGERGLGNGRCLPAGPLREPPARLRSVDFTLVNGAAPRAPYAEATMFSLRPSHWRRLGDGERRAPEKPPLAADGSARAHAVAGVGNPSRFFDLLRELGVAPIEHPFPDHHRWRERELRFDDGLPVLMTEKDAIKCRAFERVGECWALAVEAALPDSFTASFERRVMELSL